jgi:hypothetical protein
MATDTEEKQKRSFFGNISRLFSSAPKSETTPSTFTASYKPPTWSQYEQADRGEAWWRQYAWEEYATKTLPGLGLGFTVYPYIAIWEKIWGAVPTEDYGKYKQLFVQDPLVGQTIILHSIMTLGQGFDIEYPLDMVKRDVEAFFHRHDIFNLLKIVVSNQLLFGNAYVEVVRTWVCPETGHDLEALRVSWEMDYSPETGKGGYWWTDRMDVAYKHNLLYPSHKLVNPYGEILRLRPLDPSYMRVRRDAYGTILGYIQYYVFPLVTFLADEVLHFRWWPSSWTYESVYGTSMLRPILFYEEAIRSFETQMVQVTNVYLKPYFLVHVGGPKNQEATVEQFNAIKRAFESQPPGSNIFVRSGALIDVKPLEAPIQHLPAIEFWLKWAHNMRYYALMVPKALVDPQGLNRATARTLENAYFTFISNIRSSLSAQLENPEGGLMVLILKSLYGELADELIKQFGVPRIIWKALHQENIQDKIANISVLYEKGLVTFNEAREYLGWRQLSRSEIRELTEMRLGMSGGGPVRKTPSMAGGSLEGLIETGAPEMELSSQEVEGTSPPAPAKGKMEAFNSIEGTFNAMRNYDVDLYIAHLLDQIQKEMAKGNVETAKYLQNIVDEELEDEE